MATAIAARRRGLSVAVSDGAVPPIDKACGEGLMPDGLAALRALGVEIPAGAGHPFRGIRFVNGKHCAEAAFASGPALGIRRTALHRVLVEHAARCGVSMLWQTAVAGLHHDGVSLTNGFVPTRWIVGADGSNSRVRAWAGLDHHEKRAMRFGFRRHYRVPAWTDFMELYWGDDCQIYVTPIGRDELCLALVSSDPHLRLDAALEKLPELASRLERAEVGSTERGAITVGRRLRRLHRDNAVLVGDASGGVDAITGEGLCLAFRHASLLADCLADGNLGRYQSEHRQLLRRPAMMARLMLMMGRHARLRRRAMQVFQSRPQSFSRMLAVHVGGASARDCIASGISLGWQLLTA